MKKIREIAVSAALVIGLCGAGYAQQREDTSSTGRDIKKAADTIANKSAEAAANAAAKIADQTYKDKVGPQGQTVYIDKHAKYYYINKKGHKVYVSKEKLKDNPDQ